MSAPSLAVTPESSSTALGSVLAVAFSGAAYVLFLASFTGFAAVVSGLWSPWPVASALHPILAVAVNLGLVFAFGLQHTIMARARFKERLARVFPPHLERSLFVLVSSLIMTAIVFVWQPVGGQLWAVERPFLRAVLWGLVGLGYLGVVAVSFVIDHFELFGLRQVWCYLRNREFIPAIFVEPNVYRHVRHPMMVAVFVMMWATPTMAVSQALLAVFFTAYIVIGTTFEERELEAILGEPYRRYQARVSKLVPFLG